MVLCDGKAHVLRPKAADYIVALVQEARCNPSLFSEYRMIRGDGSTPTAGPYFDDIPIIPPLEA
jgi:hypothetical protein